MQRRHVRRVFELSDVETKIMPHTNRTGVKNETI